MGVSLRLICADEIIREEYGAALLVQRRSGAVDQSLEDHLAYGCAQL